MSVVNGLSLFKAAPIKDMLDRKVKLNGVSHGLAEAGYDIRVKQDIYFTPPDYESYGNRYGCVRIDEKYEMGTFCIASAIEEFQMPNDLVGIVHDKSSWARQGLSVFNTVIEPGWCGFLTLEFHFKGRKALHIPAGSGIAQVIFHRLEETGEYNGKYQNQADKPVDTIFEKPDE